MALKILYTFTLMGFVGCATGGYERYGVFDEKHDKIYQHRASFRTSFMDGGKISMAYAIVYWDAMQMEVEKGEKMPEIYYVWLRNETSSPLLIDPHNFSLLTEKGEHFMLSSLTEKTTSPLRKGEVAPTAIAGGFVAFDIPKETSELDKPSRLVYDDHAGNRAMRYLLVGDLKKYEGLVLEDSARYYAPVYPRNYWYPYYYPYQYYPYDLGVFFFYYYEPHRRHYYYIPSEPKRRKFYTPSPTEKRNFSSPGSDKELKGSSPGKERKREF